MLRLSLACLLLAGASAHADAFHDRLSAANALINQGLFDQAVTAIEELKVDYPDRPVLDYALGTAMYQRAEGLNAAGKPGEALGAFKDAETRFTGISTHADTEVAFAAAFARANAITQQAKMTAASPDKYKEGVAALRNAEQAFVEVLKRDPDHQAAQRNLDHVRLMLKKLLQNPPEKPEQNEEEEEQEQEEPPPPQPRVVSIFSGASTELPNASAIHEGNTVILQPQGAQP